MRVAVGANGGADERVALRDGCLDLGQSVRVATAGNRTRGPGTLLDGRRESENGSGGEDDDLLEEHHDWGRGSD